MAAHRYWLGSMLAQAGITDTLTQLQINIVLNLWCLICAGVGTLLADKIGRKPLAIGSLTFSLAFLYLVGAFTKCKLVCNRDLHLADRCTQCTVRHPTDPQCMEQLRVSSCFKVGIVDERAGTLCAHFDAGGYSFGWTTLLVMYPTEVLNFSLRANGMGIYTFASNSAS